MRAAEVRTAQCAWGWFGSATWKGLQSHAVIIPLTCFVLFSSRAVCRKKSHCTCDVTKDNQELSFVHTHCHHLNSIVLTVIVSQRAEIPEHGGFDWQLIYVMTALPPTSQHSLKSSCLRWEGGGWGVMEMAQLFLPSVSPIQITRDVQGFGLHTYMHSMLKGHCDYLTANIRVVWEWQWQVVCSFCPTLWSQKGLLPSLAIHWAQTMTLAAFLS